MSGRANWQDKLWAKVDKSGDCWRWLTIDHLCRNRWCVNPDHLEPVPIAVNNSRKPRPEKCPAGHDYDERNTHVRRNGKRECRDCMARRSRERRATDHVRKSVCPACHCVHREALR